jgi:hypothetical protein
MNQTIRIDGPFRLHKADPARPRRAHTSFEAAEAEANRLVALDPTATFIISREEARVCACRSISGIPLTARQA